jgi:hypothetical protein
MTPQQIINLIEGDSLIADARRVFTQQRTAIQEALSKRPGANPIDMRRMELKAVIALAVALHADLSKEAPK